MQRRAATLTVFVLFSSSSAWAQTQQGLLAGLNLFWQKPAVGFTDQLLLTAGNAWIAGDVVSMRPTGHVYQGNGVSPVPLDANPANPTTWLPNTIYYCFVARSGVDADVTSLFGFTYELVCSSYTSPKCDGTPLHQLQAPAGNYPLTSIAAFVGSFQTDSATHIIPYYRNGDEVIFAYSKSSPAGTLDPGLLAASTTYGAARPSNWGTGTITRCPIGSAASCIFDVHYTNSSGTNSTTYLLDPWDGNANPGINQIAAIGGNYTFATQAQVYLSTTGNSGPPLIPDTDTLRLRIAVDNNANVGAHQVWTGNDDGTAPSIMLVLRGFVEPIDNLCSR